MLIHVPDHFSTKLKFDFKKLPATVIDRSSILWSSCGCFFGLVMLWLGFFELISFIKADKDNGQSFLLVELFALIVVLIALGIIIYCTLSFIRYKKFYFDGKNFQIIYRPAVGVKHKFNEPLSNYIGVRLRVLFVQSGLFNKNRYIIDLYHQDSNKIIPLYISTKNKNIRKTWESYAKMLNLPALSVTDRGLTQRDCADLDKSIKELGATGKLPFIASGLFPAPEIFDITEKKDATIIKPKGIYWDIPSTLLLFISIFTTLILLAGGIYLTIIGVKIPLLYWAIGLLVILALAYFTARLFTSYTLILKDNSISVTEQLFNILIRKESLPTDIVENIELGYNPTIGRYNMAIISDDRVLTFGSRLSVADLLWIKDFVIRKLIGN
ncbi:MAG: hypothetical protein J6W96_03925 [Alphaproteobacteria bacterium]|nr:hypothetical protein [Alphaproteobacteria bacterium]